MLQSNLTQYIHIFDFMLYSGIKLIQERLRLCITPSKRFRWSDFPLPMKHVDIGITTAEEIILMCSYYHRASRFTHWSVKIHRHLGGTGDEGGHLVALSHSTFFAMTVPIHDEPSCE